MDNQELLDSVTVGGELPYKANVSYGVPKVSVFYKQYLREGDDRDKVAEELYNASKATLPKWAKDMEEVIGSAKPVAKTSSETYTKEEFEKKVEEIQILADKKYTDLLKRAKEKIEELTNKLNNK